VTRGVGTARAVKKNIGSPDETDVLVAPPRRDAWIVGNEPCIAFDFSSDIQRYAKG